nr:histidine kinase [uncultured Faecalibacillus sp.]
MFNRQSIHIALLLWGFIFSLIAAFCTSFSYHYDRNKRKVMIHMQLASSFLLLSDAVAWGSRGASGTLNYFIVRASNFFVFLMCDVIFLLFHYFVCLSLFKGKKKSFSSKFPYYIGLVAILLVIISQFTNLYYYIDIHNYYHRNTYHFISIVLPLLGMVIDFSLLIKYRDKLSKTMFISMLSYIVLPLISSIILIFYYGISLTNIAISISMIFMFISAMIEQSQELIKREKETADLKINLMISQVTPHFIFNTLTTIQQLCTKDPQEAKETIGDFSKYLRENIETLNGNELISFKNELEHVESYVKIEKKRFGNRINVEYNIQEKNFLIPAMSLQVLVENAIKHGICKKENGGTIFIETKRERNNIILQVKDDGVGFDIKRLDEKGHTGLNNLENRLNSLCSGTLKIKTQIGKGTDIKVYLPQK